MNRPFLLILVLVSIGLVFWFTYTVSMHAQPTQYQTDVENVEDEDNHTVRTLRTTDTVVLPLSGSAPTANVQHTISIEDIKQGCFSQDCIPSIENPVFLHPRAFENVLDADSLGISLSYKSQNRFYPFAMLETHELVNDVVAGDPLLISYCPLCGTGIVFDRVIDDVVYEFGVSGMLWNANLLMYNRADDLANRNLWSQVLGEAVVGHLAGTKLSIISSDIMRFSDWARMYPDGEVLATGIPRDPYNGNYYQVARNFAPNYDEQNSTFAPETYVYGILIADTPIAFQAAQIPEGETEYVYQNQTITVKKTSDGAVTFFHNQKLVPDVEGFWFSWVAAYPDTVLLGSDN